MKYSIHIKKADLGPWHVMPQDQGQFVEVAYAATENHIVRRTTTPRFVFYEAAEDTGVGVFEPWNGTLPDDLEWEHATLVEEVSP